MPLGSCSDRSGKSRVAIGSDFQGCSYSLQYGRSGIAVNARLRWAHLVCGDGDAIFRTRSVRRNVTASNPRPRFWVIQPTDIHATHWRPWRASFGPLDRAIMPRGCPGVASRHEAAPRQPSGRKVALQAETFAIHHANQASNRLAHPNVLPF